MISTKFKILIIASLIVTLLSSLFRFGYVGSMTINELAIYLIVGISYIALIVSISIFFKNYSLFEIVIIVFALLIVPFIFLLQASGETEFNHMKILSLTFTVMALYIVKKAVGFRR